MAALSADITYKFDARWDIGLVEYAPTTADVYYRGGLAHVVTATGLSTLTPADADHYAGVVSEHISATTSDLVWLATAGRWYFACANFTHANRMVAFATQSTDLTDNPATLDVVGAGDAGACGVLWKVVTTATDGWLNTDMRVAPSNS